MLEFTICESQSSRIDVYLERNTLKKLEEI